MGLSVLIVDDRASFRARARALLEAESFYVVGEAHDGASAVSAADELRPDLVLLDVHLPDASGFEVSQRLTAADPARAVVLTSARDGAGLGALVARSGARGFVPKDELSAERLAAFVR